ncbi:hypothetical protein ACKC9G_12470 [Pokkaliibacter sp. CJK22405]|uniref:hypothetical protein n=1 Tax=Pokkaliibacter sp. CJK22405 TaxID=3384615 RepID=UPI003985013F
MAEELPAVVHQFLQRKGMDDNFEPAEGEDDHRPFLLVEDESIAIFMKLEEERVVFFSLVASFEELRFRSAAVLMLESLKLNNYRWEQPVRLAMDEDGDHIVIWNELPLIGIEPADMDRYYDAIAEGARRFSEMTRSIEQWAEQGAKQDKAESAAAAPVNTGLNTRRF